MKWLLCALALTSGASLSARNLVVPADKGWKHAETGIILSPQLAGLPRTELTDATQSEHDVAVRSRDQRRATRTRRRARAWRGAATALGRPATACIAPTMSDRAIRSRCTMPDGS